MNRYHVINDNNKEEVERAKNIRKEEEEKGVQVVDVYLEDMTNKHPIDKILYMREKFKIFFPECLTRAGVFGGIIGTEDDVKFISIVEPERHDGCGPNGSVFYCFGVSEIDASKFHHMVPTLRIFIDKSESAIILTLSHTVIDSY